MKDYLDGKDRTTRFVENLPNKDWLYGFIRRHPEVSLRHANNLKRTRASVSQEVAKDFFNRLEPVVEGVPAQNLFNYDETNFTEDPGSKKAFFRRGKKYCEKVRDHAKNSVSVMFCGSASGHMLPPYVVYKAGFCYEAWCQGGPEGTTYTSAPSGWFDVNSFTDWFKKVFLPHARRLPGKKVMVGDNLRSHISNEVLSLCREHNIEFVCLPPNTTDRMQPLDVAVFGPMKRKWRELLEEMLEKNPGTKALSKYDFPKYLKNLVEACNFGKNLPAGFEKCGLFPFNPDRVLDGLVSVGNTQDIAEHLDNTLLKRLETKRYGDGTKKKQTRGQKVPAGQSWTAKEAEKEASESEISDDEMSVGEISEADEDEVEISEADEVRFVFPNRT